MPRKRRTELPASTGQASQSQQQTSAPAPPGAGAGVGRGVQPAPVESVPLQTTQQGFGGGVGGIPAVGRGRGRGDFVQQPQPPQFGMRGQQPPQGRGGAYPQPLAGMTQQQYPQLGVPPRQRPQGVAPQQRGVAPPQQLAPQQRPQRGVAPPPQQYPPGVAHQQRGVAPQQYPQGLAQQQQFRGPPVGYQGRGGQPPQQQTRGPFQQTGRPMVQPVSGAMIGRGRGGPGGLPVPDPHQAVPLVPNQAIESQADLSARVSSGVTSDVASPSRVAQQLQKLSVQSEGASSQAIQPFISSQALQPVAQSSKSIRTPRRPGKGTLGTKCIVKANHFLAEIRCSELFHYDVAITPEVPSRTVNKQIIGTLVKLYRASNLGNRLPVYDGRKSLYTAKELPFTSKEFQITLVDEDEGTTLPRRERKFRVVIRLASRPDLHHLDMFLQGKVVDAPQEALQVLDIVLRELPGSRHTPVGRSFYSPDLGRQPLGGGLESWRGFYQSIRPTQMGLSLNIDMSSTAFIEALPVIQFVGLILNKDVLSGPLPDRDRVKIKKALRGVKVEVTHRGDMRRKHRICGLTSQGAHELTFAVDEQGTMKSVVQYFQETYGFTIQHKTWPCLQVGNQGRPNYLPMEVCKIVEGQRYSKKLSDKEITALLKVTCQRPSDRERSIVQTVHHNDYPHDPYAKEFGITISKELASVEARILPPPWLKYHDTGKEKDCLPHIGQWNMMNKKLVNGGTVQNWICINFSRNIQDRAASQFCEQLADMCSTSGMQFNPNPVLPAILARPDQVEKVVKARYHDVIAKLSQQNHKELDLLIVILPDNNGPLYGDLKRICETDLGIVSQCCLTKHVYKLNKQYLANVALKINVKVGGRNTVLADALLRRMPLVSSKPTIIFGADVTHPHPGEDSSPSIAAVVASQDWPEITKYAGLVSAQTHREEMIEDLFNESVDPVKGRQTGGMIKELLLSFFTATRRKPEQIIFYRDGVSEGQFYQVLLHELDKIRQACASLEANYQPPVTFIVVQKRHHTRLFANNHADRRTTDKSGNILPGTVVDTKICHPTEFDFYLCSHAGIQGTSRPAHYHVLYDENNFTADGLQTLTNNLCYTYARCTRSVSIVPPAYYAHLAAFRARFYMEPDSSDSGSMASGPSARGARFQGPNAAAAVVKPLPPLKDNVKRVMFYC